MDGRVKPGHDKFLSAAWRFFTLEARLIVIGATLNPCNTPRGLHLT
jgi:hypothetical protein